MSPQFVNLALVTARLLALPMITASLPGWRYFRIFAVLLLVGGIVLYLLPAPTEIPLPPALEILPAPEMEMDAPDPELAPPMDAPDPAPPMERPQPAPPMDAPLLGVPTLSVLTFAMIVSTFCLLTATLVLFVALPLYLFSSSEDRSRKAGGLVKTSFGFIIASGGGVIATLGFV